MEVVLGLHVSHDASACLIINNEIRYAVQEERLTRTKFYDGFPREAVKWILGQDVGPIDRIKVAIAGTYQHIENPSFVYLADSVGRQPLASARGRIAAKAASIIPAGPLKTLYFSKNVYARYLDSELEAVGLNGNPRRFFDHHECHAATAFLPSPYQEALVITQDGRGDGLSGTYSVGRGTHLERRISQSADSSLGQIYAGVTGYLGFKPLRHEGKITGLAAFGSDTELRTKLEGLFTVADDGSIFRVSSLELEAQFGGAKLCVREKKLVNAGPPEYAEHTRFGIVFRHWMAKVAEGMSREDVAYAVQTATENVLLASVRAFASASGTSLPVPVALAGGLFANVKLNQRIRDLAEVSDVFVQPAMGDCGLSVGAALLASKEDGAFVRKTLRHVYTGNQYTDEEIEGVLSVWPSKPRYERFEQVEQEIGRLVANKLVVGRFNGAMEFGPRALGNRSIIIHPGDGEVNKSMNERLQRTEFMPFAPSVLDHRAADYFVGFQDHQITTDWMTITYNVHEEKKASIEAVVHVDDTARPQTVRAETNPSYFKILEAFEAHTGLGCFVNTSFNMHEEPIVCTPEDALRAFDLGSVDVLAIGSFIVTPRNS